MTTLIKENGKLIRLTAWVPQKKLKTLLREKGKRYSQSALLRMLIDDELERVRSFKAHQEIYGIARTGDFDDRLL